MFQSKYQYIKDKFFLASYFIIRALFITLLIIVLIDSSLHYRRRQPDSPLTIISSPKPVVFQYNFTNDEGVENTLVVMS